MSPPEWYRLLLEIQYDGTHFFGWQMQPEVRTVQGELTAVIQRLASDAGPLTGAGRTDRGVHATGQQASVAFPTDRWSAQDFQKSVNALLPPDIWVSRVQVVPHDFHPRHHAVARSYEYRVGLDDSARSPFSSPWCWALGRTPSIPLLQAAAGHLPGTHSFKAFARSGQAQRGDRCSVHSTSWSPWTASGGGHGMTFRITANRFLHHMVRYLVGTMVEIALERRPLSDLPQLLKGGDGGLVTSPPAPPQGLFLTRVEYPPERLWESPA